MTKITVFARYAVVCLNMQEMVNGYVRPVQDISSDISVLSLNNVIRHHKNNPLSFAKGRVNIGDREDYEIISFYPSGYSGR